ncbi:hypothetical protein BROUX41_003677 [Berkeleyomyces rouxiae]|uniref:uncharacterized protein n=1 Tax=Berkeleyomyces rouxiae TaxID=2035830 RepID=UPI003B7F4DA9
MGFVNAKNRVPTLQKTYQAAFKNHTRLWQISPRSRLIVAPYTAVLFGTTAACMYGMSRKALGYNSWF